jgi:hypothetical protein
MSFQDVEEKLASRRLLGPSASLRSRVLTNVQQEVSRGQRVSPWGFAAATAAALLWINLSMSVANSVVWQPVSEVDNQQLEAMAGSIRAAAPELSEHEVRRQAIVMLAER